MTYVLAIDQGTTSTRAILFDQQLRPAHQAQEEFAQHFPASGWVEHDAMDLWHTTRRTCAAVMAQAGATAMDVAAIGITNQRETTLLWDRKTGAPLHNAIVWQDRRTAAMCETLKEAGHEPMVRQKTGLLLDPYFSGTKLAWLLDEIDGARDRAAAGELAFGTVDTWLIWHMTGGAVHVTDATNAARTLLYNIRDGQWDAEICAMLDIPMALLPEVRGCDADFGITDLLGGQTPIQGVAGDQQAATVGQACFEPGMLKSTYGTGCFALLNTGDTLIESGNRLLGTIAYSLEGHVTYALEGSIFVAGAAVQWLRDGLRIVDTAGATGDLAQAADDGQQVIMVPAFTGLGAPYWDANARGAIFGLTRNTGPEEIARAALESVGYQTRDLIEAMKSDWEENDVGSVLRVDGGMTVSDWTMQFLADITGAQVDRPRVLETTALGVAWIAGMRAGLYPAQAEFAQTWDRDHRFVPQMALADRGVRYGAWTRAVKGCQAY
ncbi:glycerol kinase GlpK [Actibacterium sp. 188UL27-1]|uniref:glycerol kinase GlpK n=1 Tax=Actibacterium sp. 188UL27-1 TaxID=2786961 RepID=UPI0019586D65|nr:glycerol kinase GlpK [Actibacterium sp. 188UL27-1]MBM7069020.1 glycerol kinase GlpK [Actibacterium sp. 188UL27-1]